MVELEALIAAAKDGDVARVREVVAERPDLASLRLQSGESPLMTALYRGHRDIVAVLVEFGAELDVFAAAAIGHVDGLKRAVARPGGVNAYAYDGWTPLHLAAFFGQLETARMLLDAGADLHAVSLNGMKNTPLHAATAGKHQHVALLLLERGADPHAVDAGGYTPWKIADENQLSEVLARLEGTPRT